MCSYNETNQFKRKKLKQHTCIDVKAFGDIEKMESCIFCEPKNFGIRKLQLEDKNGYWYAVVPNEIGVFGQVLLVVTKREEDKNHITDITDPELLLNEERLLSVIKGIHEISSKLKQGLTKVEKIYVLTQCEDKNSHLHFQFYPRYEGNATGNEFLFACELEEARWQDPPDIPPSKRIEKGKRILKNYEILIERSKFSLSTESKLSKLKEVAQKLNEILM